MKYCKRCCYPANAKPAIIFDEQGVCSGCRYVESRKGILGAIDWDERERWLREMLEEYKARNRERGGMYDCLIPVSGGKDSHFQVYLMKEVYGLNPLLVTYNHCFNTKLGIRNLTNMVSAFGCDLVRFTSSPQAVKRLTRYGLRRFGDVTWHYHSGIMTYPIQTAVRYKIPLMVWGEEGISELVGMFNQDDMVEFTKKRRQEHCMRGFEPEDVLEDDIAIQEGVRREDLAPFFYPSDEEVEELGLRGIYLSNYIHWNAREQTRLMIDKYGFETAQERDRTFNLNDKLDDLCANGVHDYLKYLKFGYGRATDDASAEIRHGRMTREQGIELVMQYDHVRPHDLDTWLEFAGMTEQEFMSHVDPYRESSIWKQDENGRWVVKDTIGNHVHDPGVEDVALEVVEPWKPFTPSAPRSDLRTGGVKENVNLNMQSEYVLL